jgi:hypothetical protein
LADPLSLPYTSPQALTHPQTQGAKMGKLKTPPPLDHFIPVDFRTLQYVADNGQLTIKFFTDSQACNTRYRLIRLVRRLEIDKPNDPLTIAAKRFVFKWKNDKLTIVDREASQEAAAMDMAIAEGGEATTTDPMELIKPIDYDELERKYWEQEKGNGNEASKSGS